MDVTRNAGVAGRSASESPVATAGTGEIGATAAPGKETAPRRMTFSEMLLAAGLRSLAHQEDLFNKEYAKSEERVNEMAMVNEAVQLVNSYKNYFDKDGKASGPNKISDTELNFGPNDRDAWANKFYPALVESGKIKDGQGGGSGIGTDSKFSQKEMDSFLENARAYQSSLSSQNEQQMLLTNHAASRRTSVFQQMQTLMSTAKEALQAAGR